MQPAVLCEELSVVYGDLTAVDGISFDVRAGEVFGLLGPNGAGKTSVVRTLTTIIAPSAGRAEVAGVGLDEPELLRARIGVLPESNGYPGSETALEYIRYHGRLFGLSREEATRNARLLLEEFGLGHRADQLISTFSRGMRQRLGIARALINQPQVLFLDEPTLGLDPAGREAVLAHLTDSAAAHGTSVVLCSHHLDEVERVCDRVGILDRGRIVAAGTVAEVIEAAGVGGSARIVVAPESTDRAAEALRRIPGVVRAESLAARPGHLEVELDDGRPPIGRLLETILHAGVDVRGIELEGARLSEAFFQLTGRSVR